VREAAVARLIVAGPRAVARLASIAADDGAASPVRSAALRALEASDSPLALEAALRAVDASDTGVADAAVAVLRQFVGGPEVGAVDRLAAVALDRRRPDLLRAAAFSALGSLQPATLGPLIEALEHDSSPAMRELAAARREFSRPVGPLALLKLAAAGSLPEEPASLRSALGRVPARLSLADLAAIVQHVRDRESALPPAQRPPWTAVRASAHAALARRDSRLALYDLRETLAAAQAPLPVEFARALVEVGDATCLETIAAAHARAISAEGRNGWWRRHLAEAFRVIVAREKMTRRHTAIRRIEARWPASLRELWPGRRGQ
jgi:hypothetical protein